jgi:hypothetical protein
VVLTLAGLMLVGLVVRVWVLDLHGELNSDEVLPGLMALHIAAGQEAPVFFYGQHYFGALEAYLIAGLFRLFGFQPLLVVAPATIASLLLIPLTYALGARRPAPGQGAGLFPLAVRAPVLAKLLTNSGGFLWPLPARRCPALPAQALERAYHCRRQRQDHRRWDRWGSNEEIARRRGAVAQLCRFVAFGILYRCGSRRWRILPRRATGAGAEPALRAPRLLALALAPALAGLARLPYNVTGP